MAISTDSSVESCTISTVRSTHWIKNLSQSRIGGFESSEVIYGVVGGEKKQKNRLVAFLIISAKQAIPTIIRLGCAAEIMKTVCPTYPSMMAFLPAPPLNGGVAGLAFIA